MDDPGARRLGGMRSSRAVAALAIDCGAAIVRGMAEQAGRRDFAPEIGMASVVETGAHGPVPATRGIPAYGQLEQSSILRLVQEAAGVSARADRIIYARLEDISLLIAIAFLPPADVIGSAFTEQAIPTVRGCVIVRVAPFPVAHGGKLGGEGPSHAAGGITCLDIGVARLADAGRAGQLRTEDACQP